MRQLSNAFKLQQLNSNCSVADLNNTTMTSTTNKQRCQAITDTNGPFRECLSKLDTTGLARLKKSCEIEVDISLNELAACASLEKLLDWCNRDANVILSTNWKAILGCSENFTFYCVQMNSVYLMYIYSQYLHNLGYCCSGTSAVLKEYKQTAYKMYLQ